MSDYTWERLKKVLAGMNLYGSSAKRIDEATAGVPPTTSGDRPKTFTSPAEQDRMKADLEAAREREKKKKTFGTAPTAPK